LLEAEEVEDAGQEQIDTSSKPKPAEGGAEPVASLDPFTVAGQVFEELTEEKFMERWEYAFSDRLLEIFRKRYGAVAWHKKLFDGLGFVIVRTCRFKNKIDDSHSLILKKLTEDERRAHKAYKYHWKTSIVLNICGMETYAK